MSDVVPEKSIGTESVEIHVAADGHKLRTGEVVEGEVVFENLADFDDILRSRRLARCANLPNW